jgi:hypothetical protein
MWRAELALLDGTELEQQVKSHASVARIDRALAQCDRRELGFRGSECARDSPAQVRVVVSFVEPQLDRYLARRA